MGSDRDKVLIAVSLISTLLDLISSLDMPLIASHSQHHILIESQRGESRLDYLIDISFSLVCKETIPLMMPVVLRAESDLIKGIYCKPDLGSCDWCHTIISSKYRMIRISPI